MANIKRAPVGQTFEDDAMYLVQPEFSSRWQSVLLSKCYYVKGSEAIKFFLNGQVKINAGDDSWGRSWDEHKTFALRAAKLEQGSKVGSMWFYVMQDSHGAVLGTIEGLTNIVNGTSMINDFIPRVIKESDLCLLDSIEYMLEYYKEPFDQQTIELFKANIDKLPQIVKDYIAKLD